MVLKQSNIQKLKIKDLGRDKLSSRNVDVNCDYSCEALGLEPQLKTKKKIIVSIVGSGKPSHRGIAVPIVSESMIETHNGRKLDKHGFSTAIAGILIGDKKKFIKGYSENITLLSVDCIEENNNINHRALLGSVLWSLAKQSNIILMAALPIAPTPSLTEALSKAYDNNVSIIAAVEKGVSQEIYPNVMFVKGIEKQSYKKAKIIQVAGNEFCLQLPKKEYYTIFSRSSYIKSPLLLLSLAIFAGLASSAIAGTHKSKRKLSYAKTVIDHLINKI